MQLGRFNTKLFYRYAVIKTQAAVIDRIAPVFSSFTTLIADGLFLFRCVLLTGFFSTKQMVKEGVVLNVVGAVIITALCYLILV